MYKPRFQWSDKEICLLFESVELGLNFVKLLHEKFGTNDRIYMKTTNNCTSVRVTFN